MSFYSKLDICRNYPDYKKTNTVKNVFIVKKQRFFSNRYSKLFLTESLLRLIHSAEQRKLFIADIVFTR